MYKYNYDSNENISLHDCRATHIELNGNIISFFFCNGIYARAYSEQYPDGRWFLTEKAEMRVRLPQGDVESDIKVFFRSDDGKIREKASFMALADMINGGMKLEFVDCDYKSMVFWCWLWFKAKAKFYDLDISAGEVTYNWNEMHPYRE